MTMTRDVLLSKSVLETVESRKYINKELLLECSL